MRFTASSLLRASSPISLLALAPYAFSIPSFSQLSCWPQICLHLLMHFQCNALGLVVCGEVHCRTIAWIIFPSLNAPLLGGGECLEYDLQREMEQLHKEALSLLGKR